MSTPLALVTGGARRVGATIVQTLQAAGYTVAVHANTNARAGMYRADLTCEDAARQMWHNVLQSHGVPQLLVCNAAVFEPDAAPYSNADLWQHNMQLHARIPTVLTELLAQHTPIGQHASAVWLLDQRVLRPNPRFLSYTASKMLAAAMVPLLAQALAPAVRVNGVAPGPTLSSPRQHAADFATQCAAVPLQHASTPQHIADGVLFLARNPSITGHVLPIDSGQHLCWQTADAIVEE